MRFFITKRYGRLAKKRRSYAGPPTAFQNFRGLRFEVLECRRLLAIIQWSGGTSGTGTNFEIATNWVGGVLPGPGDEAYIPPAFASETITSATSITIQSLISEAAFQITAGTLTVATTAEVDNAFTISGGTLAGATVQPGSGGQGLIATAGSALTGVTLAGELAVNSGVTVTVNQGLTLDNGSVQLNGYNNGGAVAATLLLAGTGTQTLGVVSGSTGQMIFGGTAINSGVPLQQVDLLESNAGPLVVGAGVSVSCGSGPSNVGGTLGNSSQPLTIDGTVTASGSQPVGITGSSVTNNGPGSGPASLQANGDSLTVTNLQGNAGGIAAVTSGTLTLNGAWQNTGTIGETSSTVNLGGAWATSGLGTLSPSGGTINLTGTLTNTGQTLALPITWNLDGGSILGGNVTVSSGAELVATAGSALTGVTLAGELAVNSGVTVTVNQGLTLDNGSVQLNGYNNGGAVAATLLLAGTGTQTLGVVSGSTGQMIFGGTAINSGVPLQQVDLLESNAGPLVVGAGVSVSCGSGPSNVGGTLGNSSQPLTIDGTVTASGSQPVGITGSSVTNNGPGSGPASLQANGDSLTVTNLQGNAGGIAAVTSGTLTLNGAWQNTGTIGETSSTVNLGGAWATSGLGTLSPSGGTINLTGTLTNTGQTLALPITWNLDGGSILGGNVTVSSGAELVATAGSALTGVTLAGELAVNSGVTVTVNQGLTLDNGSVQLNGYNNGGAVAATLLLAGTGTQTLGVVSGSTGQMIFGGTAINSGVPLQQVDLLESNAGPLVVGAGVSVSCGSGPSNVGGTLGNSSQPLTIDGTVTASGSQPVGITGSSVTNNGPGSGPASLQANGDSLTVTNLQGNAGGIAAVTSGTLTLNGAWQNTGTIGETSSTVNLGGAWATSGLGTLSPSGGTINLTGTLTNTGQTLALPITWNLDGGSILGGNVTVSSGAELVATAGSALTGVTLAGELAVNSGVTVTVNQGLTLDNGSVQLNGYNNGGAVAATLLLAGTGTQTLGVVSGSTGQMIFGGTAINSGVPLQQVDLLESNAGPLVVGAGVSVSCGSGPSNVGGTLGTSGEALTVDGTVTVSSGTLLLTGAWQNNGTIEALNGASIYLEGTFTGLGTMIGSAGYLYLIGTLNNSGNTLALNASTGPLYLEFGTINGGTVTTAGGAELIGTKDPATLAGVTLAGTLEMSTTLLPPQDAGQITVTGGLTLSSGSVVFSEAAVLTFQGTQSLSGTGTVIFSNETGSNGIAVSSGSTLTISSGVTVEGNSGAVGSNAAGLIANQGTIEATGGGTLTVQGYTNFAGSTLTGGTWGAVGGSTLRLIGANITTNAAGILLDGVSSQIYSGASGATSALAGFTSNAAAGSFTIQNGADFNTPQAFTNAGDVTINSGAAFVTGGTGVYTQTGGTTILNAGTLGTAGNQVNLEGGTFSGPGTVNANLTNAAEVDLGGSPGILAVNGNYTQTAAGALTLKVGGATAGSLFDQVNVSGTASLDGALNASLINGYAPGLEESYDVLNFAASSGGFTTFNSAQINGNPAFATNATPTAFDLIGATTAPDLAVSNIAFTPASASQNQNVTVTYTVTNLGTVATTAGSWTDSVYLSTDSAVDGSAVLLGRVAHTGDLAAMAQYAATLTAPVPGLSVGSYHVIVVVDSGLQVPDVNRANNTGVAATELSTQPPALTIGTAFSATIAQGQNLYYEFNVTPGSNVILDATWAVADESELYLKFGTLPTADSNDQAATDLSDLQPEFVLPSGQGGTYYLYLHAREGAGAGEPFTLLASLAPFAASSFTPSSAANQGPLTMDVKGSGFTAQTTVSLQGGSGQVVDPQAVTLIGANELNATFDLSAATAGNYSVVAVNGGSSATAHGTFQITAQAVASLLFTLDIDGQFSGFWINPPPGAVQQNPPPPMIGMATGEGSSDGGGGGGAYVTGPAAPFSAEIIVQNMGTVSVLVPALEVNITNAIPSYFILPAATLAPMKSEGGGDGYTPNPEQPGTECQVSIQELPPQSVLDWASEELGPPPPNVPAAAWTAILENFVASVGSTEGSLDAALQADAIYLAQVGDPVTDQADLINFELEKAEDELPVSTLTSVTDSSFAEPGLPITFERSFQQPLGYRNQLGTLGYGWASNWGISATADGAGDVYIQQGAQTSVYVLKSTNPVTGKQTYINVDGNNQQVLTLAGGTYTLTGATGSVTAFLPDGQVNYVQDSNGNRSTAGYTSGLLTSLTASNGDQLVIAYNAQGLISQITDPAGNVTTYSYDAYEQLTSVTGPQGTYQYTYINGQGIAKEHALASITYPDGTHSYFSYDSQGRLIEQSGDNGTSALTYAYLSPGGYTATDATGAATTFLTNLDGQPAVITDPLGNVTRVTYNAQGQAVLTSYPGGTAASEKYDSQGNLVSQTDPLGNTSQFTTNPQTGELETFENANGASTSFAYTAQGELASITQPDGTASTFTYNSKGEVTASTDAEGRVTTYTYDSQGRVIRRDNPDGTFFTLAYDDNNNVVSATDTSGTITMTYDAPDVLTEVSYPDGQYLKYSYNAAGQLSQFADQDGFTENYAYNSAGQLVEVSDAKGNPIVSYTYDLAGRLAGAVNGNGTYTTYTYDAAGDLLDLLNFAPNGSVNSSFVYTYNAQGLETSMVTSGGTATYGYDADGQLTSVQLPSGELITYAYDAMGNRTLVSDNGATTNYTTNNTNEYTSVGGATYSYDANGNLTVTTAAGGNTTYTYDTENRLIEVQTPTDTWTCQYDALGNLAASTHNGQTTQYLVSPQGNLVGEYDASGNLIANFAYGLGLTSQVTPSGTEYYYDFDVSGNTAGLSGPTGTYVDAYSYLPFGQTQQTTGTMANPFQYNGKFGVLSAGDGLDMMGSRFYSPSDGRFITRDPLGLDGGKNYYTYAANDPVGFSDPSGHLTLAQIQALISPAQWAEVETEVNCSIQNQLASFGRQVFDTASLTQNWANNAYIEAAYSGQVTQSAIQQVIAVGLEDTGEIATAVLSDVANTLIDPAIEPAMAQIAAQAVDAAESNPALDAEVVGGLAAGGAAVVAAGDAALVFACEALLGTAVFLGGGGVALAGGLLGGALGYGLAKGLDAINPSIMISIGAAINSLTLGGVDFFAGTEPLGLSLYGSYTCGGPVDPNAIYGPGGFGPQGFIGNAVELPYVITFDNDATANAPAQVVKVVQHLDPNLDWSTFQLDDFDFGGETFPVPPGLTSYSTVIDATSTVGVYVDVDADFNPLNGVLTWTFTSLDPTTLDVPVGNVEEGFLPPDVTPPEGEGFVSYVILPKLSDPTGTTIDAQATVIFQAGLPGQSSLGTPTIVNTIDAGSPTSSVAPLPAQTATTSFNVSWSGSDDPGGSGIALYDIYVSDDGGPYTLITSSPSAGSATFTGQYGHTYAFYSLATNLVGTQEAAKTSPDATTSVVEPQTLTWSGGGADKHWSTAANWTDMAAPIPGDAVVFQGAALTTTDNDLPAGTVLQSITLASPGFQLGGNAVTLTPASGPALTLSAASGTIQLPITLGGNVTFAVTNLQGSLLDSGKINNAGYSLTFDSSSSHNSTLSGSISGTGGFVESGGGELVLSGNNSFSGGTHVLAGTLLVDSAGALPDGSSLTIGAGAASIFGSVQAPATAAAPMEAAASSPAAAGTPVIVSAVAPAVSDSSPMLEKQVKNLPDVSAATSLVAIDTVFKSHCPNFGPAVADHGYTAPADIAPSRAAWAWMEEIESSPDQNEPTGPKVAALDKVLARFGL